MRHAYTTIVDEDGYSIGRADEGTHGYTPVPAAGQFPSYQDAKACADRMNAKEGIDAADAILIVLGTIRGVRRVPNAV